jgi:hypothetical protein
MNPRLDGVKICVDMSTPRLPCCPFLVAAGQRSMSGLRRLCDHVALVQSIGIEGGIVFLAKSNDHGSN